MKTANLKTPCAGCPWRISNHGKRHKFGWYTAANLRRLWNQIRKGGRAQSCHLTDPNHEEHRLNGTKPDQKPQECPGSVILVRREMRAMADEKGQICDASVVKYLQTRKHGLTKHGIWYWLAARVALANTPVGDGPLPEVDEHDDEINLPLWMRGYDR